MKRIPFGGPFPTARRYKPIDMMVDGRSSVARDYEMEYTVVWCELKIGPLVGHAITALQASPERPIKPNEVPFSRPAPEEARSIRRDQRMRTVRRARVLAHQTQFNSTRGSDLSRLVVTRDSRPFAPRAYHLEL